MNTNTWILIAIVLVGGAGLLWFLPPATPKQVATDQPSIDITYVNATADLLTVDLPKPHDVTGKEFKIIGKARGTWFFEASFPVEILDASGKQLVQTQAGAKSDWMTTDFVPFEVDIKVPQSYIGPATVVLRKDNPSGLPDREASISYPITIEY